MRGFTHSPFKNTKIAIPGCSISKKGFSYDFSHWFSNWWEQFGAIPEILPFPILEGFKEFYQNYQLTQSEQNNGTPILLAFFSKFYLSWIMAWDLKLLNNPSRSSKPKLPCLFRSYRVK